MMAFLRAHGVDSGPLQRPLLTGALTGAAATAPAAAAFVSLGSFGVAADQVFRISRPLTAAILIAAFILAGVLYGLIFRRAANDAQGGWLFGAVFGFILWMAAPVVVLPLIGSGTMAAGRAAAGFLAAFLIWGVFVGGLFPYVHRPLQVRWDGARNGDKLGPSGAALPRSVLRRPFRR